jgi:undecaprenyl phosphate-alpha-L-ara4N flippase subunit ArnE
MTGELLFVVVGGTLFAAAGQVLFKVGASGRSEIGEFLNAWLALGLLAYTAGTLLWIYALSRARLTVVYPFAALTFVFVYAFGIFALHEPTNLKAMVGVLLILVGLFLISK